MGGNTSTPSGEDNHIDFEGDEKIEDPIGDKLIFLRNAIIQLHGQFLHFKHVQKFRSADSDKLIEEELKMMKVLIMVIYKGIEELRADKEVPRVEEISDVISRLILEFDEFKNNMGTIENLMSHLNPFDVPTLENLRQEEVDEVPAMPCYLGAEENQKELEKFRRRQIQMEEEASVSVDNSRILHGHRRIQKLLQKRVVLFVNTLFEKKTLEVMENLNKNQVDYTIFDVSADPEIRFIAKDLSDCEMFPQLFVDCEFRNLSDLNTLPKLFD